MMLARNVAHQALIHGHTVRFTTAGEPLGIWRRSIAMRLCADACVTMPRPIFW
jgi:hypothetical protein